MPSGDSPIAARRRSSSRSEKPQSTSSRVSPASSSVALPRLPLPREAELHCLQRICSWISVRIRRAVSDCFVLALLVEHHGLGAFRRPRAAAMM